MNIFTIEKYLSTPRIYIFLNNNIDTNPSLVPSNLNATDCRLWSTGSDKSQPSVVDNTQEDFN